LAPVEKRALGLELLCVLALIVASALVVARAAGDRLSRPIAMLVAGTRRVRAGDLDYRIPGEGRDEIGQLIGAWNEMTAGLSASRERLKRVERAAAWGDAARHVAHEIKNPLTPLEISVRRIRTRVPEMPEAVRAPVEESTRAMLEELAKLGRLAEEFSAFARLPAPDPKPCDLASLVREAAALYRSDGVAVEVEERAPLPRVMLDGGLLRIALGNLLKNAVEAMAGRGTIRIATRAVPEGIVIDVSDTGPGIAGADRERVFDPYFTTKPEGSGIGLALVERIVLEQGGSVELLDASSGGALFRLRLPRRAAPLAAAAGASVE
jgi:nitrogen fixation/metabolism regulation signal transduction histidine kinase